MNVNEIRKKKIHFKAQSIGIQGGKFANLVINLQIRCPVFPLIRQCILSPSSLQNKSSTMKLKINFILPKNEQFPVGSCLHD